MRLVTTARATTASLQTSTARLLRRLSEDLGVSLSSIAEALDRSRALGPRWVAEESQHPAPLYLLAARHAVPDPMFDALVAGLRSLRDQQPGGAVAVPAEVSAAVMVGRMGDALAVAGRALADGRISPEERRDLRRAVAAVRSACDRLSESLGAEGRAS